MSIIILTNYDVDRKHKLHHCFYLLTSNRYRKELFHYRNMPAVQAVKAIVWGVIAEQTRQMRCDI